MCQTDGQTADGRTDGIAVASTALAMPALRRAVKTACPNVTKFSVYMLTDAVARSSSDDTTIRYVLPVL